MTVPSDLSRALEGILLQFACLPKDKWEEVLLLLPALLGDELAVQRGLCQRSGGGA